LSRLVIVSNRLPFALQESGTGLECNRSTGGLIAAFNAYIEERRLEDRSFTSLWVGWAGRELSDEAKPRATALLAEQGAHPAVSENASRS
jgi:trehalose 6-phosphate synthase/phosphatase